MNISQWKIRDRTFFSLEVDDRLLLIYAIFGEGRRLAAPQIRKYSRMEPERCHSHRSWCGLVIPVCRGGVHLAAQLQQRGPALLHTGGEVVAHRHLKEFGQRPIQRTPVIHIHGHDAGHKARVGKLESISSVAAWSKCGMSKTLQ